MRVVWPPDSSCCRPAGLQDAAMFTFQCEDAADEQNVVLLFTFLRYLGEM